MNALENPKNIKWVDCKFQDYHPCDSGSCGSECPSISDGSCCWSWCDLTVCAAWHQHNTEFLKESPRRSTITSLPLKLLYRNPEKKKDNKIYFLHCMSNAKGYKLGCGGGLYRNASHCCWVPPVGGSVVLGDVFHCSAGGFSHGLGLALLLRIFHYEEPQVFKKAILWPIFRPKPPQSW